MSWKKDRDPVEQALRVDRPEAPEGLVAELTGRIPADRRAGGSRAAFLAALTVFMLGSFASFGGLGYAASSAQSTVKAVKRTVAPASKQKTVSTRLAVSSADDQYNEKALTVKRVASAKPVKKVASATAASTKAPPKPATGSATPPVAAVQGETLPFTGFGLGATAGFGSLLLALGVFLRRHEAQG